MSKEKTNSIKIPIEEESFETAYAFIEQLLERKRIKDNVILETKLLFEALFNNMIDQGFGSETKLTIKVKRNLGEIVVKLGFEGARYIPHGNNGDFVSPEFRIVQAYNDKIDYRYRLGYNSIRIVVKRNYRRSLIQCLIGIVLAMLIYIPIQANLGFTERITIDQKVVLPLIKQFANAMLMIGAPVTFFSLIKNLTDIYIVSEKSSSGRKLQVKTIVTSVIAILLALGTGFLLAYIMSARRGYLQGVGTFSGGLSVSELLSTMVPSNIVEPFVTYTPFPIIIVALLITYALCSIGEYFETVYRAIKVCFALFSKMLNVVMFTLPFFCFLAIFSALLFQGFDGIIVLAEFVASVLVSISVMIAFYMIRLIIGKVKIGPFVKKLLPMIWENIKINSAIDAVPFNIRYCVRNYGYSRKRLSEKLPILAHTNLDGNCFLIMLTSMIFIFMIGVQISWLHILGIMILVLFLSFGAPNQPGSVVIGILIITFFLQADELITIAIFAEVFFGALQNIINVIGDIVTIAIEEQKALNSSRA